MSAPSIPNLLSLRGSSRGSGDRGAGRGRGRGRIRGHGGGLHFGGRGGLGADLGSSASTPTTHDVTIQGTDTDAAVSRLSAVHLGYLQDPFASLFVQPAPPGHPAARRLPIINRGKQTLLPFSQAKRGMFFQFSSEIKTYTIQGHTQEPRRLMSWWTSSSRRPREAKRDKSYPSVRVPTPAVSACSPPHRGIQFQFKISHTTRLISRIYGPGSCT